MHLPRSVFSRRQVDIFLWMLKVNVIDDVPSVRSMKALNTSMQHLCGIESIKYNGALGHTYYVNNMAQLIAQEMANPHDSHPRLSEARQGQRWLRDVDDSILTPMVGLGDRDFYTWEPVMLKDRTVVMPFRWYTRDQVVCAKAWRLHPWQRAWVVLEYEVVTATVDDILLNFVEFGQGHGRYGCPSPCDIGGIFLFTPAGLEREHAQKEYNVHFLCTSNTAPPLEMLEGIVQQLRTCQTAGIWAWDCVYREMVLILVWVLALLRDNPMRSESACHRGLLAKFFCRCCWVKGSDARPDGVVGTAREGSTSKHGGGGEDRPMESSEAGSSAPRNKEESQAYLTSYFNAARAVRNQMRITKAKTASGIQDTYQDFFLKRLELSYKKHIGRSAKQVALDHAVEQLPAETNSPVWRIAGLDPHCDMPVEILHVILLGFVKYFWRDAVDRVRKAKKQPLLESRLSSCDVRGLGLSPLAGHTLVQWAGSLTGRDFRALCQVAPFVLYDLIPPEAMGAWVALARLIPLVWQPVIPDVDHHLVELDVALKYFLDCTAQWTPRWFNKPKFHIDLHLTDHIRQFGPPILFATEQFESFNAVIRSKSVHSNRHAPSRDIAIAFAQGNRIRHLMSGGATVKVFKTLTLMNGNVCDPKAWVIFLPRAEGSENPSDRARVGRIVEVLRVAGSAADTCAQPSAILVENWAAHHSTAPYNMP
ncbi:hypothetical protein JB92DRAFT_3156825 [Gautieria morchelliformis]|nr:hypothetical protein JB92DRAFT_3156825 [Gautieria morchelliformis]